MTQTTIKTTELPIFQRELEDLISRSGIPVDLLVERGESHDWRLFVKYNNGRVVRQLYTQRNSPRVFKDLQRSIRWAEGIGFRSFSLYISFEAEKPQ